MALQSCPECSHTVSDRAASCPTCGAPVDGLPKDDKLLAPLKNKKSGSSGKIVFGLTTIILLYAFFGPGPSPEQLAEREANALLRAAEKLEEERLSVAEELEEKSSGFHCLSHWNGSHRRVVDAVKATLRNPASFEHVETRVAPIDDEGRHIFFMQYRAENGYGGLNTEIATGSYANGNCNNIRFQ